MSNKRIVYHLVCAILAITMFNVLEHYRAELGYFNKTTPRLWIGFIWWLGNVLDIISTAILIKRFGTSGEFNAAAHYFMQKFGDLNGLLLFKFTALTVIFVGDIHAPTRSLIVMCSLLVWVVALGNLRQILRTRRKLCIAHNKAQSH